MTDGGYAPVVLEIGSSTDVGLRRRANEDSLLVGHPIYAVADGMGGHDAGDRASQAVVAELGALVGREGLNADDVAATLELAHQSVRSIADSMANGAGSTVTGAVLVSHSGRPHWLVFNIGDSRVYRSRDADFTQLTVDHSLVQQLVTTGRLARADMATYSGRNVITKAVGADESDADFWLYPILEGEKLVLCSDGLTGEVTDEAIAETLGTSLSAQDAADRLVAVALAHGGRDNVTVVVVAVQSGGASPSIDETTDVVPAPVFDEVDIDEDTVEVPRS